MSDEVLCPCGALATFAVFDLQELDAGASFISRGDSRVGCTAHRPAPCRVYLLDGRNMEYQEYISLQFTSSPAGEK